MPVQAEHFSKKKIYLLCQVVVVGVHHITLPESFEKLEKKKKKIETRSRRGKILRRISTC